MASKKKQAKKKTLKAQKKRRSPLPSQTDSAERRCGLCGATKKLTKTECCGQWICNDEDKYVLFSYARNSCHRNHRRYTLCASHYQEGHEGDWKTCEKCREGVETEMYVWYGTNEFNFEKLENPPEYEPTRCSECNKIIRLGYEGYSIQGGKYTCQRCTGFPQF